MRVWLATVVALMVSAALGAPRPELLISGARLAERLAEPDLTIIAVGGEPSGYEAGHLPGARFLAVSAVAAPRDGQRNEFPPAEAMVAALRGIGLGNAGPIVVYGEDIGVQAARLFVALDYLGAGDRVALLDGGLALWRAEGRPLSTTAPRVEPGTFSARLRPELLASRQAMLDLAQTTPPGTRIVDARTPTQYGSGHVPSAVVVPLGSVVPSAERPALRPIAELEQLYAAAGIGPSDVTYHVCNSGMQASLGYFIARYLGHEARLYDGSMGDWVAAGLPVEK